jgi:uncharacterized protein involved in exopolysaccharide biosynthesis
MNEIDNIKRLLIPVVKGIPIIVGLTLLAILLATKAIIYSVPMYKSYSLLRLDDKSSGLSETNLYKDFDVFFTPQKIAAEVEVLKSGQLISQVVDQLDFTLSYYRVGSIKRTELYTDVPFIIEFKHISQEYLDKEFLIHIKDSVSFNLSYQVYGEQILLDGEFGEDIDNPGFGVSLSLRPFEPGQKKRKLKGEYVIIYNSRQKQLEMIKSKLTVKSVDKDVAVLRIGYKSEVPEKAAKVVNEVAKTYIRNYVSIRTNAADKTGSFIEERLEYISDKLRESERALEVYRSTNKIVNLRQQTETGLREASQVRVQYNNILMQEAALDSLDNYVNSKNINFLEIAPQVAFGDLLFTELIKKLKTFQGERHELLTKYTAENAKVKVVESKIKDLITYLKESIKKTRQDIEVRRKELKLYLDKLDKQFDLLPQNEKQMVILEREFRLNQDMYNFLTQKKLEASIVKAATISFHQILEYGIPNRTPISPNKKLILFVSGMLGILISLAFIFLREFFGGKINSRNQLEKLTALPVIGVLPKISSRGGNDMLMRRFRSLAMEFEARNHLNEACSVLIGSSLSGEGKSYVAINLARALLDRGKSVCLIDFNICQPEYSLKDNDMGAKFEQLLQENIQSANDCFMKDDSGVDILPASRELEKLSPEQIKNLLKVLKQKYDVLILDSVATVLGNESFLLYTLVDQVLYLYRAKFSGIKYAQQAELLAEEYKWENVSILLNGVHPATNFSGHYTGSRYSYKFKNWKLMDKVKHYYRVYMG